MRGAAIVIGGLGLLGCGPDTLRVLSPAGVRSVVLVDRPDLGGIRAQAVDLDRDPPLRASVGSGRHRYYALEYADDLLSLGLPSGPLTPSDRGGSLPAPLRTEVLESGNSGVGSWALTTTVPAEVAELKLEERSPCAQFEPSFLALSGTSNGRPSMLIRLDASAALLGLTDGRLFRITRTSAERYPIPGRVPPHFVGAQDASGTIWLAGTSTDTYRGTLSEGFTRLPDRHVTGDPVSALDVAHELGSTEVWVMTSSLGVERFDGQAWTVLRPPSGLPDLHGAPAIAWLEPFRAASIGPGASEILELDPRAAVRRLDLGLPGEASSDAFMSMTWTPSFGVVAGTRNGLAYVRKSGAWVPLPLLPAALDSVYALAELPGKGLFLGGRLGDFTQWYDGYGDCGNVSIAIGRNAQLAVSLGEDLVVASQGHTVGSEVSVVYLARRP
ncbi:MAG: hypothetical protein U1E65_29100 [Myxococcota bacterium]